MNSHYFQQLSLRSEPVGTVSYASFSWASSYHPLSQNPTNLSYDGNNRTHKRPKEEGRKGGDLLGTKRPQQQHILLEHLVPPLQILLNERQPQVHGQPAGRGPPV